GLFETTVDRNAEGSTSHPDTKATPRIVPLEIRRPTVHPQVRPTAIAPRLTCGKAAKLQGKGSPRCLRRTPFPAHARVTITIPSPTRAVSSRWLESGAT